jgi:diphthine-ammonia ligase
MRVCGLISGGKDSCYNLMQCVAAGHTIVALANILPRRTLAGRYVFPSSIMDMRLSKIVHVLSPLSLFYSISDELDSYMYQTVGHEGVELIAEAMELPLFRQTTEGRALHKGKLYAETEDDEVEDLFHLLRKVKVVRLFDFTILLSIYAAIGRRILHHSVLVCTSEPNHLNLFTCIFFFALCLT